MPRLYLTCELPTVVHLGRDAWRIAWVSDGKTRAVIDATCGDRCGILASGRSRDLERKLAIEGIDIPEGTIRHRLALALVATGRGQLLRDDDSPLARLNPGG